MGALVSEWRLLSHLELGFCHWCYTARSLFGGSAGRGDSLVACSWQSQPRMGTFVWAGRSHCHWLELQVVTGCSPHPPAYQGEHLVFSRQGPHLGWQDTQWSHPTPHCFPPRIGKRPGHPCPRLMDNISCHPGSQVEQCPWKVSPGPSLHCPELAWTGGSL